MTVANFSAASNVSEVEAPPTSPELPDSLSLAFLGSLPSSAQMNPLKTILIIESDAELSDALMRHLVLHRDYAVVQASTAAEGIKRAAEVRPDLIIMDIQLRDMDGRETCRTIRTRRFFAPILMLTGDISDPELILGFEAGANDFVRKPVRFALLIARVRAHLRAHEWSASESFRIGPYEFRPLSKVLIDANHRKIKLTEKETALLQFLYRVGEKVVSRDELVAAIWGLNSSTTIHILETHIYRLRQKIERVPSEPRLLITTGHGYSLNVRGHVDRPYTPERSK